MTTHMMLSQILFLFLISHLMITCAAVKEDSAVCLKWSRSRDLSLFAKDSSSVSFSSEGPAVPLGRVGQIVATPRCRLPSGADFFRLMPDPYSYHSQRLKWQRFLDSIGYFPLVERSLEEQGFLRCVRQPVSRGVPPSHALLGPFDVSFVGPWMSSFGEFRVVGYLNCSSLHDLRSCHMELNLNYFGLDDGLLLVGISALIFLFSYIAWKLDFQSMVSFSHE